eukprot:826504-Rhodomonas_salina.3
MAGLSGCREARTCRAPGMLLRLCSYAYNYTMIMTLDPMHMLLRVQRSTERLYREQEEVTRVVEGRAREEGWWAQTDTAAAATTTAATTTAAAAAAVLRSRMVVWRVCGTEKGYEHQY